MCDLDPVVLALALSAVGIYRHPPCRPFMRGPRTLLQAVNIYRDSERIATVHIGLMPFA